MHHHVEEIHRLVSEAVGLIQDPTKPFPVDRASAIARRLCEMVQDREDVVQRMNSALPKRETNPRRRRARR